MPLARKALGKENFFFACEAFFASVFRKPFLEKGFFRQPHAKQCFAGLVPCRALGFVKRLLGKKMLHKKWQCINFICHEKRQSLLF